MSQFPPPPGYPATPPAPGYPPGAMPPGTAKKTSGAAVGSLICGILGCVPLITSLLAVILGIVGIRSTKNPNVGGRGLAIAGLILGLLGIAGWSIGGAIGAATYYATKPGREAAARFVRDLGSGNIDAAAAQTTGNISRDELVDAYEKLKGAGAVSDTMIPVAIQTSSGGATTFEAGGGVTFSSGKVAQYFAHLVQQGDALKVDGFILTLDGKEISAGTKPQSQGGR